MSPIWSSKWVHSILPSIDSCVGKKFKFHLLVDRLEKDFGPDYKVVHYIGAVLPQSTTIMDTFTIADLRKGDIAKQFNTVLTLYIPPRDEPPVSSTMTQAFGFVAGVTAHSPVKWAETQHCISPWLP